MTQHLANHETNYLICFDTVNRNYNNDNIPLGNDNPTNDVTIDLQAVPRRLSAIALSVGSLEIPLTQWTIESQCSRVYFSEHFEPLVTSGNLEPSLGLVGNNINSTAPLSLLPSGHEFGNEMALTQLTLSYSFADGSQHASIVSIPPQLNPIIRASVDTAVSTTNASTNVGVTYKTLWPHGLSTHESSDAKLICTALDALTTKTHLSNSNPHLSVSDETTFSLSGIPVTDSTLLTSTRERLIKSSPVYSTPTFGYVYHPPISGPQQLLDKINSAIQTDAVLAYNRIEFRYDLKTNQIEFKFQPPTIGASNKHVTMTAVSLHNSSPGSDSLASRLGFTEIATTLNTRQPQRKNQVQLQWSAVHIDPGQYNGASLATNLNLQFNRFYFQKPFIPAPNSNLSNSALSNYTPKFVFTDSGGTTRMFDIPFGQYTATTLANFLQAQMNLADTTGSIYTVTYLHHNDDVNNNNNHASVERGYRFTFASTAPFALEFSNAAAQSAQLISPTTNAPMPSIAARLGFSPIPYRGRSTYTSTFDIHVPVQSQTIANVANVANSLSSAIASRGLAFVWNISYNTNTNKFTIDPITVHPVTGLLSTRANVDNDQKKILVTTTDAHGLQPLQVATLTINSTKLNVLVTAVIDAFTVSIDPGTLYHVPVQQGRTDWSTLSNANVTIQSAVKPTGNLLFSSMGDKTLNSALSMHYDQLPATMLGFANQAYLSGVSTDSLGLFPLTSPGAVDLDGPSYLLLEVVEPVISSHLQHRFGNDLKQNLLAKILLHVPGCHRVERFLHVQGLLGGAYSVVGTLRVRLLNPDHTLYQLHGKNWSGTLSITALQDRVQLRK